MAKKSIKPLNPFADLGPDLSGTSSTKPVTTPRGYHDPLAGISKSDARQATKSSIIAGQYMRRTILILPEMDDTINVISENTGIKRMELARWLLAVGIEAYKKGRVPQTKKVISTKVEMPDWQF